MILIVVPIGILITSSSLVGFFGLVRVDNATTRVELEYPNPTFFANLDISVENRSADGLYDVKVDLGYEVQANISRPAMLSMFISGDRGAFTVPSANMEDAGESGWIFSDNGQISTGTYHSLSYEYRMQNLPIREEFGWAFPWDDSSSPTIYFWANFTISPRIRLIGNPPQGFVWNLERLSPASREQVWNDIPPFPSLSRLFLAPPPEGVQASAFRITLLRETAPLFIAAFYEIVGVMAVWFAGGIIWTGVAKRDERVEAVAVIAISALFSWSFRQIFAPPSLTLAEVSVAGIAFLWLMLVANEALRQGQIQPMQPQISLAPESIKDDVPKSKNYEYDVFICHASEDKEEIARPLAEALTKRDLRVWYDESTLRVGDSLRRAIDHGLANSRYGVVILSPSFFKKNWPQKELDGLVAREDNMQNVILPIWHQVDHDDVVKFSPTLADRVAAKTKDGLDTVAEKIWRVMEPKIGLETERRLLRFHLGLLKEELDGYARAYKSFLGSEPNIDEVNNAKRLLALEPEVGEMDLKAINEHILEVKEATSSIIELSSELDRWMDEEAANMGRPD